ncbi:MAG: DUF3459 domain-containing protein, partial [Actinobacteria bacterium]|nr:DUF3459 domain-containing protein [Actinomycetota bacterium]
LQTFQRSKLDWSELEEQPHADILEWHRQLVRLRRETPDLADGRMDGVETTVDENNKWLVVQRGSVTIACNFGRNQASVPAGGEPVLASGKVPEITTDGIVTLQPESATIFKR